MVKSYSMKFLKIPNKPLVATEHGGDFIGGHGFKLFIKPGPISQFRVSNYLRPMLNKAYFVLLKRAAYSKISASNNLGNLVCAFTKFYLIGKPSCIIKKFPFGCLAGVYSAVIEMARQSKIFNTVVKLISVDMVNVFMRFKIAAEMFFHYKPMFKNIPTGISARVCRLMNHFVSIATLATASVLPVLFTRIRDYCKTGFLFHKTSLLCFVNTYCNINMENVNSVFTNCGRVSVMSGPAQT